MSETVWGEGPYDAPIVIIGQNPGPDEMQANRPFVGPSGRILDRALQRVGISRSRCFITNVCKHYVPPGQPVPPALLAADKPLLDKELGFLKNRQVILTLGKEAFESLTGKELQIRHNRKGAEKNRRAWLRGAPLQLEDGTWCIPGVHPSFIMRTGFIESPLFEVDLDRVRRFGEGQRPPVEHFNYNSTDKEVREYVRECVSAGECGLDIETPETAVDDDELDPSQACPIDLVGLSCRVGESIGVRSDQLDLLRPLLEGSPAPEGRKTICWGHNSAAFDFYHLGKRFSFGGIIRADCMLGMHLLWSHLTNKDAATCFSIFTDIPYYKNLRLLDPDYYNTIGNCRDTYGALWAGQRILREMQKHPKMVDLFWRHMMGITDLVNDWRVIGLNTDTDKSMRMLLLLHSALKVYDDWWCQNLPFTSWSSPKQLIELFRAKGFPIYKRKRPGKNGQAPKLTETCDDDALEVYEKKYNSELAKFIRIMRELKHAGDFLDIAKADGRVHPRFKPHGQVGGRIQAVDPDLQNIPEEIAGAHPRAIFIPDRPKEQVFGISDFSQIEYRLYVTQAGDRAGIEQINSGDYIYGFFYEDIFKEPFFKAGVPRTKAGILPTIPPWKLLVAKSWPLGFIYGRGVPPNTGLPITNATCSKIFDDFHKQHPRISAFHTELVFQANRQGYLLTPYGRMRHFPNVKGQRNEILATPGQMVAVDVLIEKALLPLPEKLAELGGRLLFSVHDSVGWCCLKEHAEKAREVVDETMSSALSPRELLGIRIPVETKLGPSWGEAKRWERWIDAERAADAQRAVGQVHGDAPIQSLG